MYIVSYWFVYCIILIWVSYCTDLYIISYRFANRIVPIHILYRTDSYIVLYQFFYRIIPIVLYFIDSYRIISYCTDSYHIVPNGWPQGPSKVGASFNRKLPSEKENSARVQRMLPPLKWTCNWEMVGIWLWSLTTVHCVHLPVLAKGWNKLYNWKGGWHGPATFHLSFAQHTLMSKHCDTIQYNLMKLAMKWFITLQDDRICYDLLG